MNNQATIKFIIAELVKSRRKNATEAHIFEANSDPNLERFDKQYKKYSEAIDFMQKILDGSTILVGK